MVACATPDQSQPAVACLIQEKLGISEGNCPAFDVNSVCSGFVFALSVAQGMMLADPKAYANVLVIGVDAFSKIMNWSDRRTCVFFGDGAGAVLLTHTEDDRRIHFKLGSDGRGSKTIAVPAGGTRLPVDASVLEKRLNTFTMDGPKVWEFAVNAVPRVIRDLLAEHDLAPADLDLLVLHQSNLRMIEAMMKSLGSSARTVGQHHRDLRKHGGRQHPSHAGEGLDDGTTAARRPGVAVRIRRRPLLGRGAARMVRACAARRPRRREK